MSAARRLLITTDAVGGVWQYTLDLVSALRPLNWDCVIVTLGPRLRPALRDAAHGLATLIETDLPLDWLAGGPDEVIACGSHMSELSRTLGVDVVQLNQPALAARAQFSCPVITVLHSCVASWWASVETAPMPSNFVWQRDLVGQGLRESNRRICPSRALAAQAFSLYDVVCDVVHNGREPNRRPRRPPSPFALTAGRLWDRGKDIATFERAAARSHLPFQAAGPIEGPGGERISLEGIEHLGSLEADALADILGGRPIFVSTARYEPFGLAVLEAAQAGCPLVLSDIPSFRELWNGDALFVAPGDPDGFARAVERLYVDAPLRARFGERAARRAGRYTTQAMARRMASHYADALAVGRDRAEAAA